MVGFNKIVVAMKDTFGFEVEGYSKDNTPVENIQAIEKHIEMLNGLHNEAVSRLENFAFNLKYQ